MPASMIGLDWGTSTLRAFLIGADGTVLERRAAEAGILAVADGAFEGVFRDHVGDWLKIDPQTPVLASGMITSRQGWLETPYRSCPAGRDELADAIVRHELKDGTAIHFITGLAVGAQGQAIPDVMRGEETQIVGAFSESETAIAVMPGSHSKWVRIEAGKVADFTTFMTGEVYAALIRHTILGRVVTGARDDQKAFAEGLELGLDESPLRGGLLGRLFSARTLVLFDRLEGDVVPSYVSGLVLGTEIREAQRAFEVGVEAITVIGGDSLAKRYVEALRIAGIEARVAEPDRAAFGQFVIARARGLIR